MAATLQDLGSDSGDEDLVIAVGTKGSLTPINSKSHEGTSFLDESILNDRKRIELFHIRVVEIIPRLKLCLILGPKQT